MTRGLLLIPVLCGQFVMVGCSLFVSSAPAPRQAPGTTETCTNNSFALVLDTATAAVGAGAFILTGLAAARDCEDTALMPGACDRRDREFLYAGLPGAAAALLFAGSAIYGFKNVGACDDALAEQQRRQKEQLFFQIQRELVQGDVIDGVERQRSSLKSCVEPAADYAWLGTRTFIFNWTIRPDGSVADAKLAGPAGSLGGPFQQCFEATINRWQFPPSVAGKLVTEFSIPIAF